jgi:hypothetical protein
MRAAGADEAAINAFVASREAVETEELWVLHPINESVLRVLGLTPSCFVYTSGERCGFRWGDAEVLMGWHDVALDVRQRMPIAINAILRG